MRSEFVFCGETSKGCWKRLWLVERFGDHIYVRYLGVVPSPEFLERNPGVENCVSSWRAPHVESAFSDLREIAKQLGVSPLRGRRVEVVKTERGNRFNVQLWRGGTLLGRVKKEYSRGHWRAKQGLSGRLDALLRIAEEFGEFEAARARMQPFVFHEGVLPSFGNSMGAYKFHLCPSSDDHFDRVIAEFRVAGRDFVSYVGEVPNTSEVYEPVCRGLTHRPPRTLALLGDLLGAAQASGIALAPSPEYWTTSKVQDLRSGAERSRFTLHHGSADGPRAGVVLRYRTYRSDGEELSLAPKGFVGPFPAILRLFSEFHRRSAAHEARTYCLYPVRTINFANMPTAQAVETSTSWQSSDSRVYASA